MSVQIIAEIGTAHGGNIDEAKKLIDAAVFAGADSVKFQIVYADEILHPDTGFVRLPTGNIRLYDRFKELEVKSDFYFKCAEYAKQCGIRFCASPFGKRSLHELADLKPAAIKIASPELNHFALLVELAEFEEKSPKNQIPVILSSGVSKLCDIEKALEVLENVHEKTLLHCVTSYPAPEEEYNLRILEPLSVLFGVKTGVSDHSLHPILVPVLAVACGAVMIEKHICLSKESGGLDDPVALPPAEFEAMVKSVRLAERMPPKYVIQMAKEEFGEQKTEAVLGSGKKALSQSEKENYTRTNRSLHFTRSMNAGEKIGLGDIAALRTEKVLSVGLSPEYEKVLINAELSKKAQNGEGVTWEHVLIR